MRKKYSEMTPEEKHEFDKISSHGYSRCRHGNYPINFDELLKDDIDTQALMTMITNECAEIENKLLIQIASTCLGREFTPEDADRFQILRSLQMDLDNMYQLAFDGNVIGVIKRNYGVMEAYYSDGSKQPKYTITFTPIEELTKKQ